LADASADAVERREALGPTSLGSRTPKAATPGNKGSAVSARRTDRKVRQGRLASALAPSQVGFTRLAHKYADLG